jgi:hypothetical protein
MAIPFFLVSRTLTRSILGRSMHVQAHPQSIPTTALIYLMLNYTGDLLKLKGSNVLGDGRKKLGVRLARISDVFPVRGHTLYPPRLERFLMDM